MQSRWQETPPPFRSPELQPSPDTPLDTLLSTGHFRAAAILAVHLLTTATSPTDYPRIFSLLYTRLAALTLINCTLLAAQEVKALEDLNSAAYRDLATNEPLVPWELRVLAVRLQGIGFGDFRRGIMGYYDLGKEARAKARLSTGDQKRLWTARLKDLGLRVGNALVEMGDLDCATRHMEGLVKASGSEAESQVLRGRLALLWLRLGNVSAARESAGLAENLEGDAEGSEVLSALCSMADGNYGDAVAQWETLLSESEGSEMVTHNLAVCLLYMGELTRAHTLLESLIAAGHSFHGLTFNLCTIYELCSEKPRALKMQLAEKVAARQGEGAGAGGGNFEKSNADFKL
ncbi:MAG: hypothetical protein M1829_003244 [Trizodia sp. TS-e1964]|nr:MAG: hypothetical protein M1829_003244 [Trizodia sp. TS-e1964]